MHLLKKVALAGLPVALVWMLSHQRTGTGTVAEPVALAGAGPAAAPVVAERARPALVTAAAGEGQGALDAPVEPVSESASESSGEPVSEVRFSLLEEAPGEGQDVFERRHQLRRLATLLIEGADMSSEQESRFLETILEFQQVYEGQYDAIELDFDEELRALGVPIDERNRLEAQRVAELERRLGRQFEARLQRLLGPEQLAAVRGQIAIEAIVPVFYRSDVILAESTP